MKNEINVNIKNLKKKGGKNFFAFSLLSLQDGKNRKDFTPIPKLEIPPIIDNVVKIKTKLPYVEIPKFLIIIGIKIMPFKYVNM